MLFHNPVIGHSFILHECPRYWSRLSTNTFFCKKSVQLLGYDELILKIIYLLIYWPTIGQLTIFFLIDRKKFKLFTTIFFSCFNTIILQKLKIKFLPLKKCPSTWILYLSNTRMISGKKRHCLLSTRT